MGSKGLGSVCALALLATALGGCSDDDGDGGSASGGTAGSAGSAGTAGVGGSAGSAGSAGSGGSTDWQSCAYDPDDANEGAAECRIFELPLDYAAPDGDKIGIAVKRKLGTEPTQGQLWLLHGGPGASGVDDMRVLALTLPEERPDLDFYTLDHRGVGGSGRMTCPDQEAPASTGGAQITDAEWPACIAALESTWGDRLDQLSMSNSARDVGALIELVREPDVPVMIWGGSYGTRLALTYLHLHPDQPDGVILEGIAPSGQGFEDYDVDMDAVAQLLFAECTKHAGCSARLGVDPFATATAVVQSFDDGHCPALGSSSGGVRAFLGALLFYEPVRNYLPAVVHRMSRCNSADVQAIFKLSAAFSSLTASPGGGELNDGLGASRPLFFHVSLSDLWGLKATPTPEQAQASWETLTVSTGLGIDLAKRAATWPTYPSDGLTKTLPSYTGPLLMIQGGLDGATPLDDAQVLKTTYTAAHQTFVEVSLGAHNVVGGSPTLDGSDCGLDVYLQFLADPTAVIDTSCTTELAPIEFDGAPGANAILLGTSDAWGD